MLFFNFHGGPVVILLISVFIQVSISEKYLNFQCASFHEHDTLSFNIIFKGIPGAIQNSPALVYKNMKDNNISNFYGKITSNNATYKEYQNVVLTPSNGSLLYVKFFYYGFIRKPLMKFILQKYDVNVPAYRNCSSHCDLEFDNWEFGDHHNIRKTTEFLAQERKNSNNLRLVDGPQKIYFTEGDRLNIESVYLINIPREAYYVGLFQNNNNYSVEDAGNGNVKNQSHEFNNFSYSLFRSYNGFKILLRLNSSINNKDEFEDLELLHLIEDPKRTTKHPCLVKCVIWYDFTPVNKLLSDLDASAVCPKAETPVTIQKTTSETTERTKTSTGLTTIKTKAAVKTDAGTTTITYDETTVKTNGETTVTLIGRKPYTLPFEETTVKTNGETTVTLIGRKPYTLPFEETTINPTVRTALKTTDGTTMKTPTDTGEKYTAKILAIVLSVVAVVLVILISAGIYWYRRDKAPEPETDDTYFYATQLNYAELELESSDLYEAPKKDYVSVYTRIIGVLKPKSST